MFIIDDLLASPGRGLMFVSSKINEAVQQEREAQEKAAMAELTALHRELDEGKITEEEFDAREQVLLTRLDGMQEDEGDDRDMLALSKTPPASLARTRISCLSPMRSTGFCHRGVVVQGNLTIGLADVDLLFLDLRLLLGSVDTIWPEGPPPMSAGSTPNGVFASACAARLGVSSATPPSCVEPDAHVIRRGAFRSRPQTFRPTEMSRPPPRRLSRFPAPPRSRRAAIRRMSEIIDRARVDSPRADRGEVASRCHGKQAVHRMEAGRLSDEQIDNLGAALFAQAEEILKLQRQFGFSEKDLSPRTRRPRRGVLKGKPNVRPAKSMTHSVDSTNLADLLERILDKGIVIAGDISIKLVEVELLDHPAAPRDLFGRQGARARSRLVEPQQSSGTAGA